MARMKKEVRALGIVAHPDDETIWMGGTILKNKEWNWTIISLCRANDIDRMPKFRKVCEYYGARHIISDLDDEDLNPLKTAEVAEKIKSLLPFEKFDFVFTHGGNGEYGHIRHKEIYKAVKMLISRGKILCKKAFHFSYIGGGGGIPVARKKSDFEVELDDREYGEKLKMITSYYGFENESFEAMSCGRKESFAVIRR
jgi:LmbE family N-acetylglucosaminyl deacetylase